MTTPAVQRHDRLVISWLLKCDSGQLRHIEGVLRTETGPDAAVIDTVTAFPEGREVSESVSHRVGDYFREIQIGSEPNNGTAILKLTFHRRPDAGKFWKDVMMRILDSARRAGAEIELATDVT
jgi:hypothetical protein